MNNEFKILQLNVRGISEINKFNQICNTVKSFKCSFDVITLTEVKLKTTFPIQLYQLPGYVRYECLRSEKGGGGVITFITFIKSDLHVAEFIPKVASFEKIKIKMKIGDKNFHLLAYYRAPQEPNANGFLEDLENEISSSDANTFIMGDININSSTLSVKPTIEDSTSAQYSELLCSYGYKVTNNLPTRTASGKTTSSFVTNFQF